MQNTVMYPENKRVCCTMTAGTGKKETSAAIVALRATIPNPVCVIMTPQ